MSRRTVMTALLLLCAPDVIAGVSALGRIEPKNGVYQLAGPAESAVVADLLVEEGQTVAAGDALARLDNFAMLDAEVGRAEVELDHAQKVVARQRSLRQTSVASVAQLEEAERDEQVWRAELNAAQQRRARAQVLAPVDGQVLIIHAREGERIGTEGLLELGQTATMYAVAEVYETAIGRVTVGQHASVESPSLPQSLSGQVERISQLVGKNDALDLDPVARRDARVVEVFVLLDNPERVASLTNFQVTVVIETQD